ncbi:MAG: hypothetical protein ACJ8CB_28870 [Ktedonobacteraceae bacterium]
MAQQIGQQLGNYRLVSLLGHGGFADVYLGEHVHLQTQAAIKVLHTQLASDFVQAVSNRNYDQAYNDLGPQITKQTSRSQFIQNAQCEDSSYGAVTGYRNASKTSQGNSLSYVYLVTRGKLSQPYHLHLTLQQNSSGNWQVTDYNSDLSPPACH